MTNRLNQKLELWGMIEEENELGEVERVAGKIKDLWANVVPKHGKPSTIRDTDVIEVKMPLTIKCRKKSIGNPSTDMFFRKGSEKYEIVDYIPDFKTNAFWEFTCEVTYE